MGPYRTCMIALAMVGVSLGGCAAVTKGTSQKLTVNTVPQGADCILSRDGATIGKVAPTPGTVEISKSRHDIDIRCSKAGYPDGGGKLTSELEAMTFGNILVGGLVGVAVDAGTGAMNKYQPTITVPLDPNAQKVPTVPPVKPPRNKKPEQPIV